MAKEYIKKKPYRTTFHLALGTVLQHESHLFISVTTYLSLWAPAVLGWRQAYTQGKLPVHHRDNQQSHSNEYLLAIYSWHLA